MIITEDEYGFVSYQDFKAYTYKVCEAVEAYRPFDTLMVDWPQRVDKRIHSLKSK